MNAPILVTGAAGFIGMHVAERYLQRDERVIGIDNFNAYYDVTLKYARADRLTKFPQFEMIHGDISNSELVSYVVKKNKIRKIIHLAAQAGVRYSIENPFAYQKSNLEGHLAILEAARHNQVEHLVYASSSSVYGNRPMNEQGFCETDPTVKPVSLYAATKRSCELLSESYSSLYGIPQSGLRFFTVYGPWGRPDMAYFKFANKIAKGEPIEVYGEGNMARDFTYIDDIVDGIVGITDRTASSGSHEVYNIGDNNPVGLLDMIESLETALGVKAAKIMLPMQAGDVPVTFASIDKLHDLIGYQPKFDLREGLMRFVDWWKRHYHH